MTRNPPPVNDLAIVVALTERVALLEAENRDLRTRVADLVEYERIRAFDRSERMARRRWKGLDR